MSLKARKRRERAAGWIIYGVTILSLLFVLFMGGALVQKSGLLFEHFHLGDLLTSKEWYIDHESPLDSKYGFWPFIVGTLWVTGIALVLALPVSFFTAVFLTEYARSWVKRWVYPALDILAALPSVIYGMWGVLLIVPWISEKLAPHFVEFSSGYTALAGGCVLCVMVLPLLVSLFVEIFCTVPQELRDASCALGATRWQTTKSVVVRRSLPGILAAVVLALSRALGETIAVLMVCGGNPKQPLTSSVFDPAYPLPALMANHYSEVMSDPLAESALMFAALILFVVVVVFNLLSRLVLRHLQKISA